MSEDGMACTGKGGTPRRVARSASSACMLRPTSFNPMCCFKPLVADEEDVCMSAPLFEGSYSLAAAKAKNVFPWGAFSPRSDFDSASESMPIRAPSGTSGITNQCSMSFGDMDNILGSDTGVPFRTIAQAAQLRDAMQAAHTVAATPSQEELRPPLTIAPSCSSTFGEIADRATRATSSSVPSPPQTRGDLSSACSPSAPPHGTGIGLMRRSSWSRPNSKRTSTNGAVNAAGSFTAEPAGSCRRGRTPSYEHRQLKALCSSLVSMTQWNSGGRHRRQPSSEAAPDPERRPLLNTSHESSGSVMRSSSVGPAPAPVPVSDKPQTATGIACSPWSYNTLTPRKPSSATRHEPSPQCMQPSPDSRRQNVAPPTRIGRSRSCSAAPGHSRTCDQQPAQSLTRSRYTTQEAGPVRKHTYRMSTSRVAPSSTVTTPRSRSTRQPATHCSSKPVAAVAMDTPATGIGKCCAAAASEQPNSSAAPSGVMRHVVKDAAMLRSARAAIGQGNARAPTGIGSGRHWYDQQLSSIRAKSAGVPGVRTPPAVRNPRQAVRAAERRLSSGPVPVTQLNLSQQAQHTAPAARSVVKPRSMSRSATTRPPWSARLATPPSRPQTQRTPRREDDSRSSAGQTRQSGSRHIQGSGAGSFRETGAWKGTNVRASRRATTSCQAAGASGGGHSGNIVCGQHADLDNNRGAAQRLGAARKAAVEEKAGGLAAKAASSIRCTGTASDARNRKARTAGVAAPSAELKPVEQKCGSAPVSCESTGSRPKSTASHSVLSLPANATLDSILQAECGCAGRADRASRPAAPATEVPDEFHSSVMDALGGLESICSDSEESSDDSFATCTTSFAFVGGSDSDEDDGASGDLPGGLALATKPAPGRRERRRILKPRTECEGAEPLPETPNLRTYNSRPSDCPKRCLHRPVSFSTDVDVMLFEEDALPCDRGALMQAQLQDESQQLSVHATSAHAKELALM